ncbi:hypothetical protein H5410_000449, partial [Solanum commersonii]
MHAMICQYEYIIEATTNEVCRSSDKLAAEGEETAQAYTPFMKEVQSSVSHRIYSDAWDCSKASRKEEQEQKDRLTCLAKCQTSSPAVAPHQKAKRESLLLIPIYL